MTHELYNLNSDMSIIFDVDLSHSICDMERIVSIIKKYLFQFDSCSVLNCHCIEEYLEIEDLETEIEY